MKIIEPVVVAPLRREWERTKAEIREAEERRARSRTPAEQTRLLAKARGLYVEFRASLGRFASSIRLAAREIFSPCRFAPLTISICQ